MFLRVLLYEPNSFRFVFVWGKRSGKKILTSDETRSRSAISLTNQIAPQENSRELYVLPDGYKIVITLHNKREVFIIFVFKFFLCVFCF